MYKPFGNSGSQMADGNCHLRIYSDSAFTKEEETGHCMRGAIYVLCPGRTADALTKSTACHILDFVARQQRRVVRATFSAELLGCCDVVDRGILLTQLLHEVGRGDCTIVGSTQRREKWRLLHPSSSLHWCYACTCRMHCTVYQDSSR